jgi:List-Bact-rpt repeat protein/fibronectin type III domain protein
MNLDTSLFLATPINRAGRQSTHRLSTIKFLIGFISLLVASLSSGKAAQSATLAWDRNSEPNIAKYKLYYGTQSGSPSQSLDAGSVTSATVPNLNDGTTYFFRVTAINTAGLESQPSNEVSYTAPNPAAHVLTVNSGNGSGSYVAGSIVTVSASAAPAGKKFDRWVGDWVILSNPLIATTTATMPSQDVTITANYRGVDQIRFYPRAGFSARMVGGVFEGTNGDPVTGSYTKIYTITTNPPVAWTEVTVSLGDYRYLRYRGPNGSYGNVAEIEFYRNGVKLTGTGYGTPGSYNNNGNTFEKALDGNVNTRFDGKVMNGVYVGIDTGTAKP